MFFITLPFAIFGTLVRMFVPAAVIASSVRAANEAPDSEFTDYDIFGVENDEEKSDPYDMFDEDWLSRF